MRIRTWTVAVLLLAISGCWVITPGDVADHDRALLDDTATDPYNASLDDPGSWEVFDLAEVGSDWTGFQGSTFDGRYLYFAKLAGTAAYRFDTRAGFDDVMSWRSFDLAEVDYRVKGIGSTVFDGTYVYLGPTGSTGGRIVFRYDPAQAFESAASWESFDLGRTVYTTGATFDGRFVYFDCSESAQVRFDTQGQFTDGGSWEEFDASDSLAPITVGAIFDGRYVYYPGFYDGIVGRYDTQGSFTSASSWASVDATSDISSEVDLLVSGTFDGTFVYFSATWEHVLLRYDPTGSFTDPSSWVVADAWDIGAKVYFNGAVFDGRYVTYVPEGDNEVVRYDTRLAFDAEEAWASFNQASLDFGAQAFGGGAFDGRFVYLLPELGTTIARFEARNPPEMPDCYAGSFF